MESQPKYRSKDIPPVQYIAVAFTNKKTVLSQGNRAMPQLFFRLKVRDNIHYKFKSSQASKAKL